VISKSKYVHATAMVAIAALRLLPSPSAASGDGIDRTQKKPHAFQCPLCGQTQSQRDRVHQPGHFHHLIGILKTHPDIFSLSVISIFSY
jgi:hypothetical protein